MKTLKTILELPRFNDLLLLTKGTNLGIPVLTAEITETPDIANFTSSGTVLLTTAMYYKDNPLELCELVDSLVRIRCAGLGIKIGRFIDSIPHEVIAYAESKKFPLFEIPATQPLGSVLKKITNYLSDSKAEEIDYALDIQRHFSTLIFNDASLKKIIVEFGKLVKCPILLLNPFKEGIATSYDFDNGHYSLPHIISQLANQHVFKPGGHTTHSVLVATDSSTQTEVAIYPIKSNNFFPSYLVIFSPESIPYPVSDFAIDQALLVLSFVLLKNEKLLEAEKQAKGDYFYNLVERQEKNKFDEKQWLTLHSDFEIHYSPVSQIIYVSLKPTLDETLHKKMVEEKQKLIYDYLHRHIGDYFEHASVFPEKQTSQFIILLQSSVEPNIVKASLASLAQSIRRSLPIDLVFSCGQAYHGLNDLSQSLAEAKIVWRENQEQETMETVKFYRPKGMTALLESIEKEEAAYFSQSLLKELYQPVDDMDVELRKTLKTFLDNQCEIAKTSTDLFIHRNTVKYRIDNIEGILGLTIDLPENSFRLRLALELSDMS